MENRYDYDTMQKMMEYYLLKVFELEQVILEIRKTIALQESNDFIISRINTLTFEWRDYS